MMPWCIDHRGICPLELLLEVGHCKKYRKVPNAKKLMINSTVISLSSFLLTSR